jgi:hypothetical protein
MCGKIGCQGYCFANALWIGGAPQAVGFVGTPLCGRPCNNRRNPKGCIAEQQRSCDQAAKPGPVVEADSISASTTGNALRKEKTNIIINTTIKKTRRNKLVPAGQ